MLSWAEQCIEKAKGDVESMISDATGIPSHETMSDEKESTNTSEPLYAPFQLPIQYLAKEEVHPLSITVSDDLELYNLVLSNVIN